MYKRSTEKQENNEHEPQIVKKLKQDPSDLLKDIESDATTKAPFLSQGKIVKSGSELFYSAGVGPIDPKTEQVVSEDIQVQADQTFKNLGAILQEAGTDYQYVIKNLVFLADMGDFTKMNEIYIKYFNAPSKPCRTCVAIMDFPIKEPKIKLCIDSVAVVPKF